MKFPRLIHPSIVSLLILFVSFGCGAQPAGYVPENTNSEVLNSTPPAEQVFEYREDEVLLYKESGNVFFTEPGFSENQLVIDEIYIPSGSKIRTSDGVAIIVFLDDSVMTINENTEVEISFDDSGVSVSQLIGETWHRVTSLITSNSNYEVDTPSALATVRGTIFGVNVFDDGLMNLIVRDSVVDISEHVAGEFEPLFITEVKAGQGFFPDQFGFNPDMRKDLKQIELNKDWTEKNSFLDSRWKEVGPKEMTPHDYLEYLLNTGSDGSGDFRKIDPPVLDFRKPNDPLIKPDLLLDQPYEEIYLDDLIIDYPYTEPEYTDPVYEDPYYDEPIYTDPYVDDPYLDDPYLDDPYYNDPYYDEPVNDPTYNETPDPSLDEPVDDPIYTDPYIDDTVIYIDPVFVDPFIEEKPLLVEPLILDTPKFIMDPIIINDPILY